MSKVTLCLCEAVSAHGSLRTTGYLGTAEYQTDYIKTKCSFSVVST